MTTRFTPVHVPLPFVFALTVVQAGGALLFGVLLAALFDNAAVVPWHLVFTSLYVCEVLALFTHWLGHRRIMMYPFNLWYEAHTTGHHINDYPGELTASTMGRFLSLLCSDGISQPPSF